MQHTRSLIDDVAIGSTLVGDHVVIKGLRVCVHGTIHGNLRVDPGAVVELFGTVTGDLLSQGRAKIHEGAAVYGRVEGTGLSDSRALAG